MNKRLWAILLAIALLVSCLSFSAVALAEAGAVTGLKATQKSETSVDLSWNAASGAQKYQVNIATSSSGPWKAIKSVTGTSAPVSNGISAGNTYYFMVQAYTEGSSGERYYGPQSNVASVKINKAGAVGQVTNLTVSASGTTVNLTWKAAPNATKYEVQMSTTSGSGFKSQKSVSGTSAPISNLTKGKTYYFRIMPFKESSGKRVYGTPSSQKSVKISGGGDSGAVGKVSGLTVTLNGTTANLSWSAASNATKYEVQMSTTSGSGYKSQKSVSGTSAPISNLSKGKSYYFRIMPFKEVSGKRVYGTPSGEKSITVPGGSGSNVGTVTGLKITGINTSSVNLEWDSTSGAVYYEVRRSTSSTGPFVSQKSVTTTKTSNTVPQAGTYYFQVVGYIIKTDNTRHYGNPSAVVKATIGSSTEVGTINTISVKKKNSSVVTVSWNAADGANMYFVYGSKDGKNFSLKGKTSKTSFDSTVGIAGGTFYYKVLPLYQVNGTTQKEGGYSKIVSIKMSKVTIAKVTGLSASNNGKNVSLKWNTASNAVRYEIWTSTTSGGTYSGVKNVTTTSATHEAATDGTHYYKVRGFVFDFDGKRVYGDFSSAASVVILHGAAIKTIKATKVNTITMTWDDDPSLVKDGYEVYRKTDDTAWSGPLLSTHIKKSGSTYSFFDDTVVPGTKYTYCVVSYIITNGNKKTSPIGGSTRSMSTSIGTTTVTAGYGVSNTEGIFISWNDMEDIDLWNVQYSTSNDSGFTDLATVDETTFPDYEKGKLRTSGVYLNTPNGNPLQNGVAYYIRVRGVSTVNGTTVSGAWSKPRLVSAPDVIFTDVSYIKESEDVYLKAVNNGNMYLYLPNTAKYWTDGQNINTKFSITIDGTNEVKPNNEISSKQYTFSDGVKRTPSSSSKFDLVFTYNGYSYLIQPDRNGVSTWHIN